MVCRPGPGRDDDRKRVYLKAAAKAALPTAGEPKVMQRTSAVGHCTPAQAAAKVDTPPPMQYPTDTTRLGATPSAQISTGSYNCAAIHAQLRYGHQDSATCLMHCKLLSALGPATPQTCPLHPYLNRSTLTVKLYPLHKQARRLCCQ